MTVFDGRQWATNLLDIRQDHVERYKWASGIVKGKVADIGCGIGYGSFILAASGKNVDAYERSEVALEFAQKHWNHRRIFWHCVDLKEIDAIKADTAVAFEIMEHIPEPELLLKKLDARLLLTSVPNQLVLPYDPKRHSYHFRHYLKHEFQALLEGAGWMVTGWFGQTGKYSRVERGNISGMTLVAMCER
jgi:SAM-dependent methyltransferase